MSTVSIFRRLTRINKILKLEPNRKHSTERFYATGVKLACKMLTVSILFLLNTFICINELVFARIDKKGL